MYQNPHSHRLGSSKCSHMYLMVVDSSSHLQPISRVPSKVCTMLGFSKVTNGRKKCKHDILFKHLHRSCHNLQTSKDKNIPLVPGPRTCSWMSKGSLMPLAMARRTKRSSPVAWSRSFGKRTSFLLPYQRKWRHVLTEMLFRLASVLITGCTEDRINADILDRLKSRRRLEYQRKVGLQKQEPHTFTRWMIEIE